MQKIMIVRLSFLLSMQLFLAGILAVPGMSHLIGQKVDLIAGDDLKKSSSESTHHTVLVTETVTVTLQSDPITATSHPGVASVTVTMTTIKTTRVNTLTFDPSGGHSDSTIEASTDEESGTITNTLSKDVGADGITITPSATSTDPEGTSAIPALPLSSTFAGHQTVSTRNTLTTFATITAMDSPSSSTSSFDTAICEDMFCNTEGNRVCIYWAGFTSWDVSRGPIPGEIPTVLGKC
ncbi:hypothetical protein GGR50DRAFT_615407 [Xylaria sp. CBS 124048]|nr:hypothetical protein GGR50DRAFT_615407 [Xylaria sp. CBS 124048]